MFCNKNMRVTLLLMCRSSGDEGELQTQRPGVQIHIYIGSGMVNAGG